MFISVDLPEPEAPIDRDHLAALHLEIDAAQRVHLGSSGAVDLGHVLDDVDDRSCSERRRVGPCGRPCVGAWNGFEALVRQRRLRDADDDLHPFTHLVAFDLACAGRR